MVKIKALWQKIWYSSVAKETWKWIKAAWKWSAKHIIPILVIVLSVVVVLAIWRMFDMSGMSLYLDRWLGTAQNTTNPTSENVANPTPKYQTLRTLGVIIFGIGALLGIAVANRRAEAQFGANEKQSKANRDKIYNDAITHLGHKEASVRLGGAYALYELSELEPNRLKNIAEILCAHVREKTQHKDYSPKYKKRPSNEVQSILNLLSKLNEVHQKKKEKAETLLDLSRTYLNGANLEEANLQYANLQRAEMRKARLNRAQMQGARLNRAQIQEAKLRRAQMQEADLRRTQMQEARLHSAQMQGANLQETQMQGANLQGAQMQGANLQETQMQGANLQGAQMQGANLYHTQMQGTFLHSAQMQGAILKDAQMQKANLESAQMQGTNLENAQMQSVHIYGANMEGAFANKVVFRTAPSTPPPFEKRINERRLKDAELHSVIWEGERSKGDMERVEEKLQNLIQEGKLKETTMDDIIQSISLHKGKPPQYKPIPKEVITGKLTDEMANEIIKDYEEAMKSKLKSK